MFRGKNVVVFSKILGWNLLYKISIVWSFTNSLGLGFYIPIAIIQQLQFSSNQFSIIHTFFYKSPFWKIDKNVVAKILKGHWPPHCNFATFSTKESSL